MDGSFGLTVDGWVVFGVVVCPIMAASIPVLTELLLRFLAQSHHKMRSMDLVIWRTKMRLVTPIAVELSI